MRLVTCVLAGAAGAVLFAPLAEAANAPLCLAIAAGALGQTDQAFGFLDQAYEERDTIMPLIAFLPELADLRTDPKFKALLERMRLPAAP